ncbi:MAG TPA: TIR domain-containing protein [Candidatus Dormibacteraeota bacterium]|nr:TIR domain-containing protein [Candidatus Dormibacteraeota bacterium]
MTGAGAVFVSHASQDAPAAQRICDALRAAGIEVWFDESELRGGDAWDHLIRQQIRDCALFIPVISASTAARHEGYFRLEWALADQRTQMMARSKAFVVPVAIDSTAQTHAEVPDSFLRVQWTRLPDGATPPAFCARIAALLGQPAATSAHEPAVHVAASAPPRSEPDIRRRRAPAGLMIGALALVGGSLLAWHSWHTGHGAAPGAPVAEAVPEKSVAVLPFADMSEKHDQEYFSDGLAEELIDVLARIPELRVPARTSSFAFKGKPTTIGEIGRTLGVTHVLEGSVRKSGEHVRIGAQLVRADTGFHLWSQTYDRDVHDIFAVQEEIAQAVTEQLKVALLGTPAQPARTVSSEAHNAYLQARYLMARDRPADLDRALQFFQQALSLDPNYAPAWAGLAFCYTRRVAQGLDTNGVGYQRTMPAANRAISLDANFAEPHITLAIGHLQYDLNWRAGALELATAQRLDPNNAQALQIDGHLSQAIGRMSESLAHFRRAMELDPLNVLHQKYLGRALHYARRGAESVALLRHAVQLDPGFPGLYYEMGRAYLTLGDIAGAQAAFAAEADEAWKYFGPPLGYHAAHQEHEARTALAALLDGRSAGAEFQVAETYAFLGDTDKAFEWLEKARTLHDPGVIWIRRDALFASIVNDPRFAAELRKLGLPPEPKED